MDARQANVRTTKDKNFWRDIIDYYLIGHDTYKKKLQLFTLSCCSLLVMYKLSEAIKVFTQRCIALYSWHRKRLLQDQYASRNNIDALL